MVSWHDVVPDSPWYRMGRLELPLDLLRQLFSVLHRSGRIRQNGLQDLVDLLAGRFMLRTQGGEQLITDPLDRPLHLDMELVLRLLDGNRDLVRVRSVNRPTLQVFDLRAQSLQLRLLVDLLGEVGHLGEEFHDLLRRLGRRHEMASSRLRMFGLGLRIRPKRRDSVVIEGRPQGQKLPWLQGAQPLPLLFAGESQEVGRPAQVEVLSEASQHQIIGLGDGVLGDLGEALGGQDPAKAPLAATVHEVNHGLSALGLPPTLWSELVSFVDDDDPSAPEASWNGQQSLKEEPNELALLSRLEVGEVQDCAAVGLDELSSELLGKLRVGLNVAARTDQDALDVRAEGRPFAFGIDDQGGDLIPYLLCDET